MEHDPRTETDYAWDSIRREDRISQKAPNTPLIGVPSPLFSPHGLTTALPGEGITVSTETNLHATGENNVIDFTKAILTSECLDFLFLLRTVIPYAPHAVCRVRDISRDIEM